MVLKIPLELVFLQIGLATKLDVESSYRENIFLAIIWFSRSIRNSSCFLELKWSDLALYSTVIIDWDLINEGSFALVVELTWWEIAALLTVIGGYESWGFPLEDISTSFRSNF